MIARRPVPRGVALAALACLFAGALAAHSLWRAIALPALPLPEATSAGEIAARDARGPVAGATKIAGVVEHDPFSAERRRPSTRFRFPGEVAAAAAPAVRPVAADPARLIGTVVREDGSGFAVLQVGNDAPLVVRIGERLGTLTLAKVEPGRAVFTAANGSRVEVLAPKAGTTP
jgi:hypothetical protein